jgi:uncharacterized membrane protein
VPWDSGERSSFAITVMLSLIVFLLILSESLPKTDAHPLLSKMLIGLTFFSLFVVFFTVIISALYSYKTNSETPFFQCIKFARENSITKRISKISRRFSNRNSNVESYDINLEEVTGTEPESEIQSITESDIQHRTTSYNLANNIKTSTIKRRNSNLDILSDNGTVLSDVTENSSENLTESKKSVKMYKHLAAKLELIFTFIFFASFIIFSLYMFSTVPY